VDHLVAAGPESLKDSVLNVELERNPGLSPQAIGIAQTSAMLGCWSRACDSKDPAAMERHPRQIDLVGISLD
jgi:hypothetical protein